MFFGSNLFLRGTPVFFMPSNADFMRTLRYNVFTEFSAGPKIRLGLEDKHYGESSRLCQACQGYYDIHRRGKYCQCSALCHKAPFGAEGNAFRRGYGKDIRDAGGYPSGGKRRAVPDRHWHPRKGRV